MCVAGTLPTRDETVPNATALLAGVESRIDDGDDEDVDFTSPLLYLYRCCYDGVFFK